jgi:hypothetical protein
MNIKGDMEIRTRVTKSRQRVLKWNDPDMLALSDMFFDLLIAGQLPLAFINTQYHLQNRDFIRDYYTKFEEVEKFDAELNELGKVNGERIYKEMFPAEENTKSWIPTYRQMRA